MLFAFGHELEMNAVRHFRLISHLQRAVVTIEKIEFGRQPASCEAQLGRERDGEVNHQRQQHDESAERELLLSVAVERELKNCRQSEQLLSAYIYTETN